MPDTAVLSQSKIEPDNQQKSKLKDIDSVERGTENDNLFPLQQPYPQSVLLPVISVLVNTNMEAAGQIVEGEQLSLLPEIDREGITKFINDQGFLTYVVKTAKIHSYLKSLLDLAGLLTYNMIYQDAKDEVEEDILNMMWEYVDKLHHSGDCNKALKSYHDQIIENGFSLNAEMKKTINYVKSMGIFELLTIWE